MRLTQPELIQIFRKRAGLNQAELGSRAFDTTIDAGRTKIKNIELGVKIPTDEDLRCIANCLEVPVEQLKPTPNGKQGSPENRKDGIWTSQKVIDMFPDLDEYLLMLEKAAVLDDFDLMEYLSGRIAEIFKGGLAVDFASSKRKISGTEERIERG